MTEQLSPQELLDIADDYTELVTWLHVHDREIGVPQKLREDLHDMVYKRLEP